MLLQLAFYLPLLVIPPVATAIGIRKATSFWPLAFATFLGTTMTVVNFRFVARMAEMAQAEGAGGASVLPMALNQIAWLGLILLGLGLSKMRKMRREQALRELLAEDEDD